MSPLNRLINETTGEIDMMAVSEAAQLAAAREYGSPDFPPRILRRETEYVMERASAMRRGWRMIHNLSAEEPGVPFNMPSWGASGDSFGRG